MASRSAGTSRRPPPTRIKLSLQRSDGPRAIVCQVLLLAASSARRSGTWSATRSTIWRAQTSPPASASSAARPASPIGESPDRLHAADTYGRALLVGLLNTLKVAVLGIVLATILGTIIGIARLSRNWLVAQARVGLCRGDPQHAAAAAAPLLVTLLHATCCPAPREALEAVAGRLLCQPRPACSRADRRMPAHRWMLARAAIVGIVASVVLRPLGAAPPGRDRPAVPASGCVGAGLIVGLPLLRVPGASARRCSSNCRSCAASTSSAAAPCHARSSRRC